MATQTASFQTAYALVQVTTNESQRQNPELLSSSGVVHVEEESTTGIYRIDFEAGLFNGTPAVLVTQAFRGFTSGGDLDPITDCTGDPGGDTRDNAVVICIEPTFCRLKTGDSLGASVYRSFSILALGT
jgi:hypothetical protein